MNEIKFPDFIPRNKSDLKACEQLGDAGNEDILPFLNELLTWIQDANWPVAAPVAERLIKVGKEIIPSVNTILRGDDDIWKYWVISLIILKLDIDSLEATLDEVIRIINTPTPGEVAEKVNLVARDVMIIHGHTVQK